MTYLRPRNRERVRRNRAIATAAIAIAAIVGVTQAVSPSFFPVFFTAMARPFWREAFMIGAGGFSSPSSLAAENEALRREIADLRLSMASSTAAILAAQDQDLLAFFNRASTSPRTQRIAAVIARPGLLSSDELIIDLGGDDGVASTSGVYAPGRVFIGKVRELLPHSAKVALFTSPRESYPVLIGPKRVPATAVGRGGGQYRADVPHGSAVAAGDAVSDGSLYDRAFGVVTSVITDPANPFDTVLFAPPVNVSEIRYVMVEDPAERLSPRASSSSRR